MTAAYIRNVLSDGEQITSFDCVQNSVYLFLFICTYWHYMTSEVTLFVQFNQNHIFDSDEKDRRIKLEQQKQYMLVI